MLDNEPVIFYDCYNLKDCLPANATPGLGDNPIVGVAHPVDPGDANLTEWKKDPKNPISIRLADGTPVTRGFAGPSNLWRVGGKLNMLMQLAGNVARYESEDPSLHNWTVVDPNWFPQGGRGGHGSTGVTFFAIPKANDDNLTLPFE